MNIKFISQGIIKGNTHVKSGLKCKTSLSSFVFLGYAIKLTRLTFILPAQETVGGHILHMRLEHRWFTATPVVASSVYI